VVGVPVTSRLFGNTSLLIYGNVDIFYGVLRSVERYFGLLSVQLCYSYEEHSYRMSPWQHAHYSYTLVKGCVSLKNQTGFVCAGEQMCSSAQAVVIVVPIQVCLEVP
jgi:hypothetical protein